ncbi:MAG: glgE1, partial [Marmoricola sp.]|nr:glgE1 [Marmoricola sp.]
GAWTFEIQAWSDPIDTWLHDAGIKIRAGVDVELMFTEGVLLLQRVAKGVTAASSTPVGVKADRAVLKDAIKALGDTARPVEARLAAAESDAIAQVFAAHPLRDLLTVEGPYPFFVDRERALFSSWYEFFPRSEGALVDPATG